MKKTTAMFRKGETACSKAIVAFGQFNKAVVIALCMVLLALCSLAVLLTNPQLQATANAVSGPSVGQSSVNGAANNATPRATGTVNYTFGTNLYEDLVSHYVVFTIFGGAQDIGDAPHNGKAERPANDPTEKGFIFTGWYADSALTTLYDFDTPVTQDIEIYSGWEPNIKTLNNATTVYDGLSHTLSVELNFVVEDGLICTYLWTFDNDSAFTSTEQSITYKDVSQSGTYTCEVSLKSPNSSQVYKLTLSAIVTVAHTAAYNSFIAQHGAFLAADLNLDALTYAQYSVDIPEFMLAYKALAQLETGQFSTEQAQKIANIDTKIKAVASAKTAAEQALAALGSNKAEAIALLRNDGIAAYEAKIAIATAAINAYKGMSSVENVFVLEHLTGNALYTEFLTVVSDFKVYKTFYDKYKPTWESGLDESAKIEKSEVDAMAQAYASLTGDQKELLDAPEKKAIEDVIAKYATGGTTVDDSMPKNTAVYILLIAAAVAVLLVIVLGIVYNVKRDSRKKQEEQNNATKKQ